MLQLHLSETTLPVLLVRCVRKSIGLRIIDGQIELRAHPRVPMNQLQRLLEQKRDWIERHWRRQVASLAQDRQIPSQVFIGGQALELERAAEALPDALAASVPRLQPGEAPERLRQRVAEFLYREAARRFPSHLSALAPLAVRPPCRLSLSRARTRWGSCSAAGVIRLNWRLVQAPLAVLDYVIAHELAHLRHMNHSAAFWAETARLYPDWQAPRAWLKQQGNSLFRFG